MNIPFSTSGKKPVIVHPIRLPFTIPAGQYTAIERFVYAYIIETANGATLIDTGVSGSFETLRYALSTVQGGISSLRQIILTHSHPDHIGTAARIVEMRPVPVFAHDAEVAWIEDVGLQKRERPVPGFDGLVAGSVRVSQRLNDNERLNLGDVTIQVLHTPGHSLGSISLFIESEGILFSGDAVVQQNAMPIYTDVDASLYSLYRLQSLPNLRALYSAWDEPVFGEDAYDMLERGVHAIETVHRAVMKVDRTLQGPSSTELCAACIQELGLPPFAANPLTAVTFDAHRRATLLSR
jgi:glyoxylase-like metal-dependent hydrolase (beta-lactamase superfamily II)